MEIENKKSALIAKLVALALILVMRNKDLYRGA